MDIKSEKWEHWHPKGCQYLGESVATLCYVDLKEGILSVEIELAYQIVHLQFLKTLAYRVHLEECVPDVWMKLHSPLHSHLPSQWTFWEILNSCWIAELKTTGGLALYPRARHFAVVTEQNLVEVLTQDEPMCPLRVTERSSI